MSKMKSVGDPEYRSLLGGKNNNSLEWVVCVIQL